MFSFSLASAPSLMVVTQERVGVAINDPEHSTHSIEMYHLANQSEFNQLSTYPPPLNHMHSIQMLGGGGIACTCT